MNLRDSSLSRELLAFYFGEMSGEEFSDSLYKKADEFESEVEEKLYLEFISCNYSSRADIENIKRIIGDNYSLDDPALISLDRAVDVSKRMISGRLDLLAGCGALASLRLDGYPAIPPVFAGYYSELSDGIEESVYRSRILQDLNDLLSRLLKER